MVKLIMTDIDGTLIPDVTMDINPEYFEVIEKLVEKGIIFVVASGRHMSLSLIHIFSFFVCFPLMN